MDWIATAWTVMCTSSFMLAVIYLFVWINRPDKLAHLSFAIIGFGVGIATIMEFATLRATSVAEYAALVRWFHVPMFFVLLSLVVFVRLQFQVGRLWLAVLYVVLRLAVMVVNFTAGENMQFREITALKPMTLWGAELVAPVGIANPWVLLAQVSVVVLVAYFIDAALQLRRRPAGPERASALRIVGSIALIIVLGSGYAGWAVAHSPQPLVVLPPFVALILIMSYEIGMTLARSDSLAENLRVSEWHMELAGHSGIVGQWAYGVADGSLGFTDHARALLGFGPGEAIDRERLLARIHADDREDFESAFRAARAEGTRLSARFRIAVEGDDYRWLIAVGSLFAGSPLQPPLLRGVLIDVTELRQSEERFRQVVKASPTAILIVEADGRIEFANEQCEAVFGYSSAQLCQMHIEALVPPDRRVGHAAAREGYARQPAMRRMGEGRDLYGLHRDGRRIPLEIGIASIPSDHGPQFLATITDISERRAMERESAMQRDELAHLSRVALLSELSGSLAHELNQPLTAILSNAQAAMRFMAHSPPNLEEVRESLANIVESDKRAGEVIRRLRAMLRKDPPEFQPLDINEVIQDVLRIIRSDLLNRNVETHLQLAPGLPLIQGDRVQLQQVMLNLIMNGADAMADLEHGRILTLRTQPAADGGVEVQVGDGGKGIPVEDLERIFSPFVTSKRDGMGLGLAVCTTIAQAHRGRLWATNNAGPGATLHLVLPSGNS